MIKITPADKHFSYCVRERAEWKCERCGTQYQPPTTALHCSHFMGRGNWGTRFDPLNASAHCMGCHLHLGSRPAEFMDWVCAKIGQDEIDRLRRAAKTPAYGIRKRVKDIAKHYREQWEHMMTLRMQGVKGRLEFRGWSEAETDYVALNR